MARMQQAERTNLPVPLVIGGVILLVLLAIFGWVALGMGSAPAQEAVTVDVPQK